MKRLIYFAAMLVVWLVSQSQDIEVTWEYPSDLLFERYIEMDGGSAITVIVKGNMESKKMHINRVVVTDTITTVEECPTFTRHDNEIQFPVVTKIIGPDLVKSFAFSAIRETPIANPESCILMETMIEQYDASSPIPLIAFAPGVDLGNTIMSYCRVRDAKLNPAKWSEELGLKNYMYWELVFED